MFFEKGRGWKNGIHGKVICNYYDPGLYCLSQCYNEWETKWILMSNVISCN